MVLDVVGELVKQFREGRGVTEAQRKRLSDSFKYFQLSNHARHSQLRFQIPLDIHMFREIAEAVRRSPLAAKRIGEEWLPENAEVIRRRTDDDRNATGALGVRSRGVEPRARVDVERGDVRGVSLVRANKQSGGGGPGDDHHDGRPARSP